MKLAMISTDKKIFDENSAVRSRMAEYGNLVQELHIIVMTGEGFEKEQIAENVWAYPTNSKSKWRRVRDAIRIGKTLKDILLVTAQDPFEAGLAGWRIARKLRAKLELQVHTDIFNPFFARESFLNVIRARIARFLLPKASGIRVVSKRVNDSLVRLLKIPATRINILPIFTDTKKIENFPASGSIRSRYPQFDQIALTVSRLTREKNIALAIRALAPVVKNYPKIGFIIIGDGPEKHALGQLVAALDMQNNVIFAGWQNETTSFYESADFYLQTSDYEGYGLSLIEAATAELPIVTTDVGVVGDVINKDNALVCPVGDEVCITRQLMMAIENKGLQTHLASSASRAVHSRMNFPKEEYLERIKRNWEQCLI